MADSYKRLGAIAPADSSEQILYSTKAGKSALISNITVANRTSYVKSFSINTYDTEVTPTTIAPQEAPINAITLNYANGIQNDYIAVSTDAGITWTGQIVGSSKEYLSRIVYGGGVFIATGDWSSNYYRSADNGVTWQTIANPYGSGSFLPTYINGQWVATPKYGWNPMTIKVSADGVSWTDAAVDAFLSQLSYVGVKMYFNDLYIFFSQNKTEYYTSPDLVTWTLRSAPGEVGASDDLGFISDENGITAVSYDYQTSTISIFNSIDGVNWTTLDTITGANPVSLIAKGGGSYILSYSAPYNSPSSTYYHSLDGTTWTTKPFPYSNGYWHITHNGSYYVAVTLTEQSGTDNVYTSIDGISWTAHPLPISGAEWRSAFGANAIQAYSSAKDNALYKNATIEGNTTEILEPGITLNELNAVLIKASSGLTISAFGVELDQVDKYKILGQEYVNTPDTDTNIYSVPNSKQALVRSIVISNTSTTEDVFSIAIKESSTGSISDADYIFVSNTISANETIVIKAGYTLSSENILIAKSLNGTTTFTAFGMEL